MKTSSLSILLASLMLATASYAQPVMTAMHPAMSHHHGHGHMRAGDSEQMIQRHLDHMAKAADATPEQKAKLDVIAKTAQADIKPLREQLRANRERGTALYTAPSIDRVAMEQHHAVQFKIMEQISKRRMQARLDSAEVLSAEQRAKLATMIKKHHSK